VSHILAAQNVSLANTSLEAGLDVSLSGVTNWHYIDAARWDERWGAVIDNPHHNPTGDFADVAGADNRGRG